MLKNKPRLHFWVAENATAGKPFKLNVHSFRRKPDAAKIRIVVMSCGARPTGHALRRQMRPLFNKTLDEFGSSCPITLTAGHHSFIIHSWHMDDSPTSSKWGCGPLSHVSRYTVPVMVQ